MCFNQLPIAECFGVFSHRSSSKTHVFRFQSLPQCRSHGSHVFQGGGKVPKHRFQGGPSRFVHPKVLGTIPKVPNLPRIFHGFCKVSCKLRLPGFAGPKVPNVYVPKVFKILQGSLTFYVRFLRLLKVPNIPPTVSKVPFKLATKVSNIPANPKASQGSEVVQLQTSLLLLWSLWVQHGTIIGRLTKIDGRHRKRFSPAVQKSQT